MCNLRPILSVHPPRFLGGKTGTWIRESRAVPPDFLFLCRNWWLDWLYRGDRAPEADAGVSSGAVMGTDFQRQGFYRQRFTVVRNKQSVKAESELPLLAFYQESYLINAGQIKVCVLLGTLPPAGQSYPGMLLPRTPVPVFTVMFWVISWFALITCWKMKTLK